MSTCLGWKRAVAQSIIDHGLIHDDSLTVMVYNWRVVAQVVADLKTSFPKDTLHCFAVKANPVAVGISPVLFLCNIERFEIFLRERDWLGNSIVR